MGWSSSSSPSSPQSCSPQSMDMLEPLLLWRSWLSSPRISRSERSEVIAAVRERRALPPPPADPSRRKGSPAKPRSCRWKGSIPLSRADESVSLCRWNEESSSRNGLRRSGFLFLGLRVSVDRRAAAAPPPLLAAAGLDQAAVEQRLPLEDVPLGERRGAAQAQVLQRDPAAAATALPPAGHLAVHQGDVVHDQGLARQLGGAVHDAGEGGEGGRVKGSAGSLLTPRDSDTLTLTASTPTNGNPEPIGLCQCVGYHHENNPGREVTMPTKEEADACVPLDYLKYHSL
ncbi:hypothetical protein EYF80_017657 [Liparis tanakae]|uniref:Uncharacterized protein n=1 Tax=Liparis tanakae TaxID=230148 RepID=A0A4Z2I2M0_9TELE|nr:hypothetical protein EYF80_017657 [Liparis tanakae]